MSFLDKVNSNIVTNSTFQPCYVFGLHKSGSTLLHKMISDSCQVANIPALNLPNIAFHEGVPPNQWASDESLSEVFNHSMVYFGFRFLPQVLLDPKVGIKDKKFVLLVRDPRDALVSQFFSYGGKHISHKLPKKNKEVYLDRIQKTAHLDIDEYVLFSAKGLVEKLKNYHQKLNIDKRLLLKYENVYFDKLTALKAVFDHFEFKVEETALSEVAKKHDQRPGKEDPSKHIRKGSPGDHKSKLRSETIDQLTNIFSDTMSKFGYTLT